MKTKIFFSIITLFVVTICSAQSLEIETNKNGAYRLKKNVQEWEPLGIAVDAEAARFIDIFYQAVSSPGTPVLVEESEKFSKLKPVFKKLAEDEKVFIIYKEENKRISSFVNRSEPSEKPSYFILFSIASIILMIILNILRKKESTCLALIVLVNFIITGAAAVFVASLVPASRLTIASFFSALASAGLIIAIALVNNDNYKALVIAFYILMTMHIVFLFI